jgi:hypothetical protein
MIDRHEWCERLFDKFPSTPKNRVERFVRSLDAKLADFPEADFTMESLDAVFFALKTPNSFDKVRTALQSWSRRNRAHIGPNYTRPLDTPAEPSDYEKHMARLDELRAEWGDYTAVRHAIKTCNGEDRFLHVLATILTKYAPQHLGEIPPRILDQLEREQTP